MKEPKHFQKRHELNFAETDKTTDTIENAPEVVEVQVPPVTPVEVRHIAATIQTLPNSVGEN